MQGIELSRRFYRDLVAPWLADTQPGLGHAAALIGYGSELLGFDDDTSRDHNWGPRLLLFVSPGDFAQHADSLVTGFAASMPAEFLGEPIGWRSRPHPAASGPEERGHNAHGLEVMTLRAFAERMLGRSDPSALSTSDWLGFTEQRLLAFTAGAVFHDGPGALTAARSSLSWYPLDIWLYRLACQWRRIAEEQAFVGRAGQVGDDLGSRVEAARMVREIMRLGFLLERRYAPYPKWLGSGFALLPIAADLLPLLQAALRADDWHDRQEALARAYHILARRQLADRVGATFTPRLGPYHERPFTTINADEIIAATCAAIADPRVRDLPVIGGLDQVSDNTALLEDPVRSGRVVKSLFDRP
jgi:hypothetical protein